MLGLDLSLGLGASNRGFNPVALFAGGEKGVILLPENSGVGIGSGVGTVTDTSGNGKNATQGTAGNKPILRQDATTSALYLEFDGTDDWLQTAAVDFTGTDSATVFAAFRKVSDAARGIVTELGVGNGRFTVEAPASTLNGITFIATGTSGVAISSVVAAPVSRVLTGLMDISLPYTEMRLNGASAGTSAVSQGAGNLANAAIYIGRRGGTSLPFNGYLYGLIIVGRICTAAEIAATETFLNRRIGAY